LRAAFVEKSETEEKTPEQRISDAGGVERHEGTGLGWAMN